MVRDAEAYAEKDRSRKELVEARNEADTLAYSVEKSLAEYKVCVCMCISDASCVCVALMQSGMAPLPSRPC